MKRILIALSLALCAPIDAQVSTNALQVTPELIGQLSDEASTNNAALKSARSRVKAAEHNERSIPLFKDPEVMAGGMVAEKMMRMEDGDVMFGVEQELPVFGKPQAARKVAEAETVMQEAELTFEFQNLRKELAQAVFKAALADELLAIAEADLAWLETTTAITERRYEFGDATQLDVLRVQNEHSRRAELLKNEQNNRVEAYVTVNRLLFRNIGWPWPRLRLPEVAPGVKFSNELLDFANRFEPRIKLMEKEVQRARAMARQTRVERRPDLMAGVQGRIYSGASDYRSTEIFMKLSIPLFNKSKYREAEKRDLALAEAAEWAVEDYSKGVREEIHHLTTMIDNARREALLYRDEVIPRSRQALAAAEAAWQQGNGMFRDVLEMRRMLLDAETMYVRAVAEQWINMSELVLCCGLGDLEALMTFSQEEPSPAEKEGNQ